MTDASSDTPVLDTLAAMTAESVARCELDANSLLAARIAALAAVHAPAASYLMHVGTAMDAGVTVEQVQNILIAVAPIIGTPRTLNARPEHHRGAWDRHRRRRGELEARRKRRRSTPKPGKSAASIGGCRSSPPRSCRPSFDADGECRVRLLSPGLSRWRL